MQLFLLFALNTILVTIASAQFFKKDDDEDELGPICKALLTVTEAVCQDINLPVGVDVEWCNREECIGTTNICEPSYPCKWEWKTTKVNICTRLGITDEFIEGQKKLCGCWKDIYKFRLDKIGDAAVVAGKLQGAVSAALSTGVEGMVCVAQTCDIPPFNGAVCLRDNQEQKEKYLDNLDKDGVIIKLPEIGIELYLDFVTRIGTCATSGACILLRERFRTYLKDSFKEIAEGIKDYGVKLLKRMGGPIAAVTTAVDASKNFMKDLREDGEKCDVKGVNYNELENTWKNIEKLGGMLIQTKDALNFEKGINQIQALFGSDDDKVLGLNIKTLQAMIDIPTTITAILETADVMSDLALILPEIPGLFAKFQDFALHDMKPALTAYASNLNDPACKKAYNVLTEYHNEISTALGNAYKLNFMKLFTAMKDTSKVKFVPGIEKFDHWLGFKLKAPQFVWKEFCPFHFINHNSTLPCITVPMFQFSTRSVGNRKLVPGFLPYVKITFPF